MVGFISLWKTVSYGHGNVSLGYAENFSCVHV